MALRLRRPEARFDLAEGLLSAEHFQTAYTTNDMDRALTLFKERLGIARFAGLQGDMPDGGHIRVEVAWVGTIMYELMQVSGPGAEFFMDGLPKDRFGLRHHHLGYLLHDKAQWDAVHATAARHGYAIPRENDNPGFIRHCFVAVPEIPHYLEYIWPEQAGLDFFQNVPAT